MGFEEKLYAHRETFKGNIRGMGIASALGINGEQVIDYYGVANLINIVKKVQNPAEFVSLLFLDALINSCAHVNGKNFTRIIDRDVLVLNSYIYHEPMANITHQYPQIILGLKENWGQEDISVFRDTFKEYILFYFDLLPAEVFITLKKDPDLSEMKLDYPSLGVTISKNVLDEFQKLRREF